MGMMVPVVLHRSKLRQEPVVDRQVGAAAVVLYSDEDDTGQGMTLEGRWRTRRCSAEACWHRRLTLCVLPGPNRGRFAVGPARIRPVDSSLFSLASVSGLSAFREDSEAAGCLQGLKALAAGAIGSGLWPHCTGLYPGLASGLDSPASGVTVASRLIWPIPPDAPAARSRRSR